MCCKKLLKISKISISIYQLSQTAALLQRPFFLIPGPLCHVAKGSQPAGRFRFSASGQYTSYSFKTFYANVLLGLQIFPLFIFYFYIFTNVCTYIQGLGNYNAYLLGTKNILLMQISDISMLGHDFGNNMLQSIRDAQFFQCGFISAEEASIIEQQ